MVPLIDVLANDIDPAGVELEAALPVAWLGAKLGDAEARAVSPGRIVGRLSRSGRADIVVRARIDTGLAADTSFGKYNRMRICRSAIL